MNPEPKTIGSSPAPVEQPPVDVRNPLLQALGERVRNLRARRGLTRKALAAAADVSERHLANLEYGVGNASFLVLHQVAAALRSSLAEVAGDVSTSSPEWLLIRDMLGRCSEAELRRVRIALTGLLDGSATGSGDDPARHRRRRIALIGLRGAGKSTLGRLLADDLGLPFIELSRRIETIAGCSIREIHDLYGNSGYRRYERQALDDIIRDHAEAVIATPGGIVSEAATFNRLLAHCTTVWLQASPEDHMKRVTAQGDLRPMAASHEAMDDLRRILAGRTAFYAKADFSVDTTGRSVDASLLALRALFTEEAI